MKNGSRCEFFTSIWIHLEANIFIATTFSVTNKAAIGQNNEIGIHSWKIKKQKSFF